MQILKPVLIGISYICLFRSTILNNTREFSNNIIKSLTHKNMETDAEPISYQSGSNSIAFVTTPDENSAKKLAHSLISEKLVACVNIIPNLTSIYLWEDEISEDKEYLMMIKTRTSRIEELTKYIQDNHPYSVAEVITLPIESGNLPYLNWISKTVPDKP